MEATQLEFDHQQPPKSTAAMVTRLRQEQQDFEWYPTTEEILSVIKQDMEALQADFQLEKHPSILDCGAGDGRSLNYLSPKGDKYAIEKSEPLITAMDRDIFIIGSDFHQQILLDKSQDVTFSNPPYSDYVTWSTKIIRESRSGFLYLVIPERWKKSDPINQAIELREAESEVIGQFDFLSADRQARAKVDIVRINLKRTHRYGMHNESKTDPFDLWFEENFKIKVNPKSAEPADRSSFVREEIQHELVQGRDLISVLTSLYDRDMEKLMNNYKAFESLDGELLQELGVSFAGVRAGLKQKISGLKNLYWQQLFDNLQKITDKLTLKSRENMLKKLTSRTDVDFNAQNVYAIVIWVIKNANHYYDDQLIQLVERMVEKANVVMYKSNQRTFGREDWLYCRRPDDLNRFSLETRVILQRCGGLVTSDFSFDLTQYNGLSSTAYHLIMDILTVATNLGFDATGYERPRDYEWVSNKSCDFHYHDHRTGKTGVLMSVKAFKNGNTHIKFNAAFMARLNVEFGRLQGWLKTAQDAVSEMDIDDAVAAESFESNLQLTGSDMPMLGFDPAL